ncbi:MAG: hypothetical protein EXR48_04090 [Dehalococcoidia bacterium]|nr:hypothetical protein [Dehalococcoidia bacterium]
MTTRQEVLEALKEADRRLDWLSGRIKAHPDAPLPQGTWKVRDCMSHVAARAEITSIIPTMMQMAEVVKRGGRPSFGNIDEVNSGQVAERKAKNVEGLIAETKQGHAQAVKAIGSMSEAQLAHALPKFWEKGEISVAEMLIMNLQGNEGVHLNDIEAALERVAPSRKAGG